MRTRLAGLVAVAAALSCVGSASAAAPPPVHITQGQLGFMTDLPIMDGAIAWASFTQIYLRELNSPVLQTVAAVPKNFDVERVFAGGGRIAAELEGSENGQEFRIEVYDRDGAGWRSTRIYSSGELEPPPSCGRNADLVGVGSEGEVIVQYDESVGVGGNCTIERPGLVVVAYFPDGTTRTLYEKWKGWTLRGTGMPRVIGVKNSWLAIERSPEKGTFLHDGATGNQFPLSLGGAYPEVDASGRVIDNNWVDRKVMLYPGPGSGPPIRINRRRFASQDSFCGDQILERSRRVRPPSKRSNGDPIESGPIRLRLLTLSGAYVRTLPETFPGGTDFSGCDGELAVFTTYRRGPTGGTQVHVALRP